MSERVSGGRCADGSGDVGEVRKGRALTSLVAAAFGLREGALVANARGVAIVAFARQVVMYLAHTHLGMPLTRAGKLVARDRATARHACRLVEDRRDDPRVDELIACIERGLDVAVEIARFHPEGRDHG